MRRRPRAPGPWIATLLAAALALGLLPARPGGASDDADPRLEAARRAALILFRALSHDDNLEKRAGKSVDLAIVYNPNEPASVQNAALLERVFADFDAVTMQGLPFRSHKIPFHDPDDFSSQANRGVDVIYLCSGLQARTAEIKPLARTLKMLTVADGKAWVDVNVSVVYVAEERPQLVVNLRESRLEGALFSTSLLRLARVTNR